MPKIEINDRSIIHLRRLHEILGGLGIRDLQWFERRHSKLYHKFNEYWKLETKHNHDKKLSNHERRALRKQAAELKAFLIVDLTLEACQVNNWMVNLSQLNSAGWQHDLEIYLQRQLDDALRLELVRIIPKYTSALEKWQRLKPVVENAENKQLNLFGERS